MGKITGHPQVHRLTARVLGMMGVFTGVKVVEMLCGAVRTKLVAVWTGYEGVALYGVLTVALELFCTLSQTGLRTSAVRSLSGGGEDNMNLMAAVVRKWSIWLGLAVGLLMLAASPLLSFLSHGNMGWVISFMILALAVPLLSVSSSDQAVLQGRGHLGSIARSAKWIYPLTLAVAVPLLYWLRDNGIAPLIVAGAAVSAVIYARARRTAMPGFIPAVSCAQAVGLGMPMIRLSLMLSVSALATWGATYLFMAWLDHAGGDYAVSLYQSGNTLVYRYMGVVFAAMALEYYPRLSSLASGSAYRLSVYVRHELGLVLKVAVPLTCLFALLAPLAVNVFYTRDFMGALPYIVIAAPATVLRAVSWCLAFVILANGDGRLYMATEIGSALLMLALNITGYALWGMAGLGVAYVAWYLIYAAAVGFVVWRFHGVRPTAFQLWIILGSLLLTAMCAGITLLHYDGRTLCC